MSHILLSEVQKQKFKLNPQIEVIFQKYIKSVLLKAINIDKVKQIASR